MAKDTLFSYKKTLNIEGRVLSLEQPMVMGILNATPDSFFEGSRFSEENAVLKQVEKMLEEGAHFIDVGGYSTRPGAEHIPLEEEIKRTAKKIKKIKTTFPEAIISADTFRSKVALSAIENGASIINDVSGGMLDKDMMPTVARAKVPYILMHMRGTPQTMNQLTQYNNLVTEVVKELAINVKKAISHGINDIIIDPGFGFSKTADQNYELLKNLDYFKVLKLPLLIGLSRKSMIWRKLDCLPEEALNGTTVLNTVALLNGANILRVHDVKQAIEAIQLVNYLKD